MKDDAFRKYKKERPKLANLSSQFFVIEPASASAPATPIGKEKRRRKKNRSVDKGDKSGKERDTMRKDKKARSATARRKSFGRDTGTITSSASVTNVPTSPQPEERKERKWAAFKRSGEGRSGVKDSQ